jgi:hypothetical protein
MIKKKKKLIFVLAGAIVGVSITSGALALGSQLDFEASKSGASASKFIQPSGDVGDPVSIDNAKSTIKQLLEANLWLGNVSATDRRVWYFGSESQAHYSNLKRKIANIWAADRVDEIYSNFKEILAVDNAADFDNHFDDLELSVSEWQGVQVSPSTIHALFTSHFVYNSGASESTDKSCLRRGHLEDLRKMGQSN